MANILSQLPSAAFRKPNSSKFAPQLTFDQRCAALALVHSNVVRSVVAAAFGVDRRTISHIATEGSRHYKDVRAELKRIGLDAFVEKYVREEHVQAVTRATAKVRGEQETLDGVSPRANKFAGMHTVKPDQCSYSHRIEIAYSTELPDGAGWYYRDLESSTPEMWLHNGEDSRRTSNACYQEALANMLDETRVDAADAS